MIQPRTYLDHNATSILRPEAKAAMVAALEAGGNASSVHSEGRDARRRIDLAREQVSALLGVRAGMVVFTSGGTEANNLALRGAPAERLIVSSVEHPAVLAAANGTGKKLDIAPVDGEGRVILPILESLLQAAEGQVLVSIMLANNETGVLQDLTEIAGLTQKYSALLHTDAVQAAGRIDLSFLLLGADLLTVSAHKLGGPQGAGALVVRDGLDLEAQIQGGGQELYRRGGTENVAAIAGFGAAAAVCQENLQESAAELVRLRDLLEQTLLEITPRAEIFGHGTERLPNTVCFAHPGMSADTALIAFDLEGVAVSSGSACSSGKVAGSSVLSAMAVDDSLASGAIRVSLGWNSNVEDIEHFATVWSAIAKRHHARAAA